MFRRKYAIEWWYNFPPRLTSVSALPCKTGNTKITPFHFNVVRCFANKHSTSPPCCRLDICVPGGTGTVAGKDLKRLPETVMHPSFSLVKVHIMKFLNDYTKYGIRLCISMLTIRNAVKKVKFSHTRYRALGPELIPRCTGSQPAGDVKWITPYTQQ